MKKMDWIEYFRKIYLLSVIMLFVLGLNAQSNIFDFDSLSKYSYLITEVSFHPTNVKDQPSLSNLFYEGNATGYFVKDSNKLFLCSAYHVFSSCDVYEGIRLDTKADYLIVRIYDSLMHVQFTLIPINFTLLKTLPCGSFLERLDFITLDVTAYFKGFKVNSIEDFISPKRQFKKFKIEAVISYGYPGSKLSGFKTAGDYDYFIKPTQYFGRIDTNYFYELSKRHILDSMYYTASPSCYPGSSGAPVFFEEIFKKKKIIVFAGTQSGTNFLNNQSIITKGTLLEQLFKMPKLN